MNSSQWRRVVCLFRNDLRVADNPALLCAADYATKSRAELLCVYCFDKRQFGDVRPGLTKTGPFRARFLVESVVALRNELQSLGSDLHLFHGEPENIIPELCNSDSSLVVLERNGCDEELRVEKNLSASVSALPGGSKVLSLWGAQTLINPEDLPFDFPAKVPSGFTTFRKKLEQANVQVRPPLGLPDLTSCVKVSAAPAVSAGLADCSVDGLLGILGFSSDSGVTQSPPAALAWRGGERAARDRLNDFCKRGLATYKSTRNKSIGPSYSTKLSPWLALGCITARQIQARVSEFENANGGQTVHTYWVHFELLWRDFFRFYCLKQGNKVWRQGGPVGSTSHEWVGEKKGNELFDAWRAGRTGVPFVDGHMRELLKTGFMSNRGRQNVASFLVHNCKVDWRLGAAHFESLLLDYDPCSNVGNWLSITGLTGGRTNVFNMAKQAKDYDPDANHARLWCDELRGISPGFRVHSLPALGNGERSALAPGYPAPICNAAQQWRRGDDEGNAKRRNKTKQRKGRAHYGREGRKFVTR